MTHRLAEPLAWLAIALALVSLVIVFAPLAASRAPESVIDDEAAVEDSYRGPQQVLAPLDREGDR